MRTWPDNMADVQMPSMPSFIGKLRAYLKLLSEHIC